MSNNLTQGAVQVFNNDVASINLALIQLQERSDQQKGLRGRAEVWDRNRVNNPTDTQDAVTLGDIDESETTSTICFYAAGATPFGTTPGTSYVEVDETLRQRINFNASQPLEARITVVGWGTDSGAGKAVAITRPNGDVIAEVTWDGTDEGLKSGDFTDVTFETDQIVQVHAKGATAGESLIIARIILEMRYNVIGTSVD